MSLQRKEVDKQKTITDNSVSEGDLKDTDMDVGRKHPKKKKKKFNPKKPYA